MAQPTKPVVSSVWASTAPDNVTPTDAFIAAGWPQSTTPPSRGRFNWLLNYLYNGIRYFSRRGIADYDAAETYMTNDKTMGPDGLTYISLIDTNIGHTPSSSPTQWARWGLAKSELDSTYARLAQFAATLSGAGSGYMTMPVVIGGTQRTLILQWFRNVTGTSNGSGFASIPLTFPTPFTTAVLGYSYVPANEASSQPGQSLLAVGPSLTTQSVNLAGVAPSSLCAVSGFILGY